MVLGCTLVVHFKAACWDQAWEVAKASWVVIEASQAGTMVEPLVATEGLKASDILVVVVEEAFVVNHSINQNPELEALTSMEVEQNCCQDCKVEVHHLEAYYYCYLGCKQERQSSMVDHYLHKDQVDLSYPCKRSKPSSYHNLVHMKYFSPWLTASYGTRLLRLQEP